MATTISVNSKPTKVQPQKHPEDIESLPDKDGEGRKTEILKDELIHYCENTTVHGFAYLPGPYPGSQNWYERIFWILVILAGFTCASIIINQAFTDWADNPTITTTATYSKPVTLVQVSRKNIQQQNVENLFFLPFASLSSVPVFAILISLCKHVSEM